MMVIRRRECRITAFPRSTWIGEVRRNTLRRLAPLADPTLTLVRSSDRPVIATNDNWQSAANSAQLQAAGVAPSNALESAILITLDPGA